MCSPVSPLCPFFKSLQTLSGILSSNECFSITLQASLKVLSSGTVGPDAIISKGSPITSDSISVINVEGNEACARCPPFIIDKCFLTALISSIVAPQASSSFEVVCISCKAISFCGCTSKAEPPPEIKHLHLILFITRVQIKNIKKPNLTL
jgi:hypothetical protein